MNTFSCWGFNKDYTIEDIVNKINEEQNRYISSNTMEK